MDAEQKAREERIFRDIQDAMEHIAAQIDQLEKMNDFELVAMYEEIEGLCTRISFTAVSHGMFDFQDGSFDEAYDPSRDEILAQVSRHDALTKQHPTDAYRRFRAIADQMDEKWTAVEAILNDRQQRARAGANAKHANDPSSAAKLMAIALWPLANQKGWTAERMHIELQTKGHTVKQDTVRKWMTKLRKSGTC
jgi:hypothetical protein